MIIVDVIIRHRYVLTIECNMNKPSLDKGLLIIVSILFKYFYCNYSTQIKQHFW
jgi:hypothetical protein